MTRLEQAQGKLQRLKRESEETHRLIRAEHDRIPFGQPNIIGRGDIYKKVNGYHDRAIKLLKEQEKQEKRGNSLFPDGISAMTEAKADCPKQFDFQKGL